MKFISKYNAFLASGLSVFLTILVLNNFLGNATTTIVSDGFGYYDYLPAVFIYEDLDRKDYSLSNGDEIFNRFSDPYIFVNYKDVKINKYPVGTALLQFPFFYPTFLSSSNNEELTGYERKFQKAIQVSSLFYLGIGLFFLSKLFQAFQIKWWLSYLILPLVPLSTNIIHYVNSEAAFSHVYSFAAISAFAFFSRTYFSKPSRKKLLITSILIGLIILLRQINVLVILAIPLLAGSKDDLVNGFKFAFKDLKNVLALLVPPIILFIPQSISWYLQSGDFLIYSYQDEGFNFLEPHILDVWFSYKKGLFVYTPVLFLSTVVTFYLLRDSAYRYTITFWWVFFIIITYVFSSWWSWWYGASYGHRVYIDFFAILFLPLVVFLNDVKPRAIKVVTLLLAFFLIPINVIQAYQYDRFIIHWIDMDKEKYWKVFLKYDDRYEGIVWKKYKEEVDMSELAEWSLKQVIVNGSNGESTLIQGSLKAAHTISEPKLVEISFEHEFDENRDIIAKLDIKSKMNGKQYYTNDRPLLQYTTKGLNGLQHGVFQYEVSDFEAVDDSLLFRLRLISESKELLFKDVRLKVYGLAIDAEELNEMISYIKTQEEWLNKIESEAIEMEVPFEKRLRDHAIYAIKNTSDN